MREYGLYINDEFVESESRQTFDSINPFNQQAVAKVARAGVVDALRAISAAREAFDRGPWRRMPRGERSTLLKAVSDKINERAKELIALEVDDSGRARRSSSARSLPCSTASGSTTPGAAQPSSSTAIGSST